jgi:hypothetical protein
MLGNKFKTKILNQEDIIVKNYKKIENECDKCERNVGESDEMR